MAQHKEKGYLHKGYEEFTEVGTFWSWVILIVFSGLIMGWGMFVHMMSGMEQPRGWDFGVLPDLPAESAYSTVAPPRFDPNVPLQIQPLPEAFYDKNAGAAK